MGDGQNVPITLITLLKDGRKKRKRKMKQIFETGKKIELPIKKKDRKMLPNRKKKEKAAEVDLFPSQRKTK